MAIVTMNLIRMNTNTSTTMATRIRIRMVSSAIRTAKTRRTVETS